MSLYVIFAAKSTFLVLLPNIVILKKHFKTCNYQTCNDFSVIALLTKAHMQKLYFQKLYFSPQFQTGSYSTTPINLTFSLVICEVSLKIYLFLTKLSKILLKYSFRIRCRKNHFSNALELREPE
jgi:hypothetical protein